MFVRSPVIRSFKPSILHQPAIAGFSYFTRSSLLTMGDLNNDSMMRELGTLKPDPAYLYRSIAIDEQQDDPAIRQGYRPFLSFQDVAENDWVAKLELSTALKLSEQHLRETGNNRVKVLVLYGSLRER